MSWTIELVGSSVFIATDTDGRADNVAVSNAITASAATALNVSITAGDPDFELKVETDVIAPGVAASTVTDIARYTLAIYPYVWNDAAYTTLLRLLAAPYTYIRCAAGAYPNWRHDYNQYYACRIADVKIEHKHETGTKLVTVTLYIVRL